MIINEDLIELHLQATDRLDALNQLSAKAYKINRLKDKEKYLEKVIERESQISTDMGNGIAIPHGKADAVTEAFVVFAKLEDPIIWNESEGSKVDLVFMLGVPEISESNTHLRIISQLAAELMDDEFLEKLRNTEDKKELLDRLTLIQV